MGATFLVKVGVSSAAIAGTAVAAPATRMPATSAKRMGRSVCLRLLVAFARRSPQRRPSADYTSRWASDVAVSSPDAPAGRHRQHAGGQEGRRGREVVRGTGARARRL